MSEHESWRVRGPRIVAALQQYGQPCSVSELSTLVDDGKAVQLYTMEVLTMVGAVRRVSSTPRLYAAITGEVDWDAPDAHRFGQATIADLGRLARAGRVTGKRQCRLFLDGRWSSWNRLEVLGLVRRSRDDGRIVAMEITPKGRALLHQRGVDVPPAVSLARPLARLCALCGQPPSPFAGAIEEGSDGAYHAVCRLQVRYEAGEHVPGFAQPVDPEEPWPGSDDPYDRRLDEPWAEEPTMGRSAETSEDAWGPTEEPTPDEVDVQALALSMLQQCAKIINAEQDWKWELEAMEARLDHRGDEVETLRRNLHEVQKENGQLRQAVADERAERLKLRVDLERWVNGRLVDNDAVKLAVKAIRAGG